MEKEYIHIRLLLRKFYDGETTPDEERTLAVFFRDNDNIPEDLETDRSVFRAMETAVENTTVPEGLAESIMEAIDRRETEGKGIGQEAPHRSLRRGFRKNLMFALSAAAAIAVLVMLTPFVARIGEDTPSSSLRTATATAPSSEKSPGLKQMPSTAPVATVAPMAIGNETAKKVETVSRSVAKHHPATQTVSPTGEEAEAMELGLAVLAKAGRHIAYARQCVEATDAALEKSLDEVNNALNIINK